MSIQYCQVFPNKPEKYVMEIDHYNIRPAFKKKEGRGCLFWFILVCAILILSFSGAYEAFEGGKTHPFFLFSACSFTIAGIAYGVLANIFNGQIERHNEEERRRVCQKKAELEARENQKRKEISEKEARDLTTEQHERYQGALAKWKTMSECLKQSNSIVDEAISEYHANAYGPFWDLIEAAAIKFSDFEAIGTELKEESLQYMKCLECRRHNFPVFPVSEPPDPVPYVTKWKKVVRMGRTHKDFSIHLEHRLTRNVMISSFRTINDTLYGLGDKIIKSTSDVKSAIQRNTKDLSQEIRKLKEKLSRTPNLF